MTLDADILLAGPRGRRVCLEFALRCAQGPDASVQNEVVSTVRWAIHRFEAGTLAALTSTGASGRYEIPAVSVGEAASALNSIDLIAGSAETLRDCVADSVAVARYWQEADGADALAATDEFRGPLRRVADVVASSAAAAWWTSPVDVADQWAVPWEGAGRPPEDPAAALTAWRRDLIADDIRAARERPADPAALWSGIWWSNPPRTLVHTTRSLGGDGPARLWFEEDSLGGDEAVATPVDAYPAHVIEITGPEDWVDLCRRHPLDVSASRRHDWYRVTGRAGVWIQPDWSAVAREADGVHLTVAGYLSAATRLIEVDADRASVLAGWNPDETYWFRGTAPRPADQRRWTRIDGAWVSAAG